jgi:hypothetical protein
MMQLGLVLWIIATEILHFHEALNVKRYDVLFLWFAIALLFSPAGQADLHRKWRSPFSRYFLTIVFCAIYGSTGILKLIYEPGWWTGAPLDHFLLHPLFGQKPVGLMLSGSFLTAPMGWWTLAFEVLFPFLIWFRRTNLLLLVLGVGFHLGLLFLMDVGAFSFVAMAAYPALLHPEVGRDLHARFAAWRGRSASPAGPM